MTTAGRTTLITGASGGIGLELARLFAADGYNLVLVARNEPALRTIAADLHSQFGISANVIATDLSLPRAPDAIHAELQKERIFVDVLVNNAGFATHGIFAGTDLATELQEMQLNIVALTHLTKLFVREMTKRGCGKILNVASTAAFQPGPGMAVYYASKAYVLSFTEALANELRGTGVTATALCPGPTATGFQARAGVAQSRLFRSLTVMDAATVAKIGYRATMKGKPLVIAGARNRLFAFSTRFAPRKMLAEIIRKLHGYCPHSAGSVLI